MRKCPSDPYISCTSSKDSDCKFCSVFNKQNDTFDFQDFLGMATENTFDKQDDMASVRYINYSVKNGVSLKDCLKNLGYVKKLTPPNCGRHVKVPDAKKEATLSDILNELVRIKLILTVGK